MPEACPCGLGDCDRQRETELEGQVGIKDLEPHVKEGSSGRDVGNSAQGGGAYTIQAAPFSRHALRGPLPKGEVECMSRCF